MDITHLNVSVNHVAHVKGILVVSNGIEEGLSNSKPTVVDNELKCAEDGEDHVWDGFVIVDLVDSSKGSSSNFRECPILLPCEVCGTEKLANAIVGH